MTFVLFTSMSNDILSIVLVSLYVFPSVAKCILSLVISRTRLYRRPATDLFAASSDVKQSTWVFDSQSFAPQLGMIWRGNITFLIRAFNQSGAATNARDCVPVSCFIKSSKSWTPLSASTCAGLVCIQFYTVRQHESFSFTSNLWWTFFGRDDFWLHFTLVVCLVGKNAAVRAVRILTKWETKIPNFLCEVYVSKNSCFDVNGAIVTLFCASQPTFNSLHSTTESFFYKSRLQTKKEFWNRHGFCYGCCQWFSRSTVFTASFKCIWQ